MLNGMSMKKLPRPNIFICLFCGWGRAYSADEEMRDGAVGKCENVRDLTRILVSRPGFLTEISFRHLLTHINYIQ